MVQWLLSNFQNFLFQIEKLLSQKAKLLNFFIHIINRAIKNCFGPDCAAKFVQWQWMNYSSKQRQPSRVFSLSIYLDVYGVATRLSVSIGSPPGAYSKKTFFFVITDNF